MQFKLAAPNRPSVFLPYKTHKRSYHLLFTKKVDVGRILAVKNSDISLDTFFKIGEVALDDYTGAVCAYIFYSNFPVACHGTCIIAYSKQWAKSVNKNTHPIRPFGVNLLLRTKHFYIYHRKNNVTLIVNPNMAKHIRDNLEI